ncbi:helix-turn-helix transcriptional regulator [Paraneptunicella aestuarii]|uniref:helix-turn-helix transcriptional regulator n=1 Tax=Paraneptunicella aestuarii TaxID=2831148 RepID=UPI001E4B0DA8|nr:helix-turn-helix transcriptional regulator [Paraneptunicella aestuarii]UAA37723.1 helix-turn-helix transcriptional regulator [Paraneptunicella aestuarii]
MRFITGEELRAIRQYSRYTITEIAQIVGVKTRKTVMNWEKNVGHPSINQFLKLLEACGINDRQYFHLMFERKSHALICFHDLVALEKR